MRKLKNFIISLFVAIGVTSSFVSLVWVLFSTDLNPLVSKYPWGFLLLIFSLAFLYAIYVNRSKNRIDLKLSEKVKATVCFGDLFKTEEIIVIAVNEYFDTLVDDKIISSKTIHGIFVRTFFGGDEKNLKQQLKNGLTNYEPLEVNSQRSSGNKEKYPLGTVCEVTKGNKVFYLVALTRFNENQRAEIKNSEYQRVLCDLFSFIEQNSQGRKINIPLIGAGHSGVNLSKQKLLEFLLFSISLKDGLTLINGVNIILHDSVRSEIDLSSTEILFKSIGS